MKPSFIKLFGYTLLVLLTISSCKSQTETNQGSEGQNEVYTKGKRSYDGIGKYYLGREIAQVMGHLGANWLERTEREAEEKTSLLVMNLELESDDVVADIGAGTGYFSFRMAEMVPKGKVIAVDIQPEMLAIIEEKMEEKGVENIELVRGEDKSPKLSPNSVDAVLFVDVYHELSYPKEMMEVIVNALTPNGKVYLVEYRMEDPTVPIKRLHKMSVDQAVKEMEQVGLKLKENRDMLPWQHFMIFEKK